MKRFFIILFSVMLICVTFFVSCSDGKIDEVNDEVGGIRVPLSRPQNVTAKLYEPCCIDVSWDYVSSATSYVVYYRLSSDDSEENLQKIETESTYITIKNLIDKERYDFWVTAKNTTGESDRSDVVSAFSYYPTPTEPQNVTATASGLCCINISWDPVDYATSYVVYYQLSSEDSEENLQKTEIETSYYNITIKNLIDEERYDFWVIAKNPSGESDRSDVVSAKSYFPAPRGVSAYAQGTGYARVSWNSVIGATSYEIYAEEIDSYYQEQEKRKIATGVGVTQVVRLTSRSKYRFYVKAVCNTKSSDFSLGTGTVLIH